MSSTSYRDELRREAELKAMHDIAALGRAPHEWQSYSDALWEAAAKAAESSSNPSPSQE